MALAAASLEMDEAHMARPGGIDGFGGGQAADLDLCFGHLVRFWQSH